MFNREAVAWMCADGEYTDSWSVAESWCIHQFQFRELTPKENTDYLRTIFAIGQELYASE